MVAICVLNENEPLTVVAGKRRKVLKKGDLSHYHGERGRRGLKLPRGYQNICALIPGKPPK